MRRALITFCVFVLLGVAAAVFFYEQRGLILIAFGEWRIQTSLAVAVIALIVIVWLALAIISLVAGSVSLPRRLARRWSMRRDARQYAALADGFGRLAEQRWRAAEIQLKRVDGDGVIRAIARLAAACSASFQNRTDARDQYLADARFTQCLSELAVELTATEFAVRAGEFDVARDRLARLNVIAPHHPRVLTLYAEELARAGEYGDLRRLLPDVEKHAGMEERRWLELARVAWLSTLAEHSDHAESLISNWSRIPGRLKNDPVMIETYVGWLHAAGVDQEVEKIIRSQLNNGWSPSLARFYGQLAGTNAEQRLRQVEQWLRLHGEKPELLLLAGRLCLRAQLWGRARHYFEQSQAQSPRADVLLELGSLYEQLGEPDSARAAYRDGLALQVRE